MYVDIGSMLNLSCVVSYTERPPIKVSWLHNGIEISFRGPRNGVSVRNLIEFLIEFSPAFQKALEWKHLLLCSVLSPSFFPITIHNHQHLGNKDCRYGFAFFGFPNIATNNSRLEYKPFPSGYPIAVLKVIEGYCEAMFWKAWQWFWMCEKCVMTVLWVCKKCATKVKAMCDECEASLRQV